MGSDTDLEQLNRCRQVSAVQAGVYFYTPNTDEANEIIRNWAEQNICFCGFIHSHVAGKKDLSQNDIEFAKQLFNAFRLPVLWFGLGIVDANEVHFRFYSIKSKNDDVDITSVCWKVGGEK